MRTIRRVALGLALVVLVVVLGILVPRPLWPADSPGQPVRRILVVGNEIHTDIALPLDADVVARFAAMTGLPLGHPEARWLVFGWGSRAFYIETPTWSELKVGPLFKALTLDSSVMHVGLAGPIDDTSPAVTAYMLDDAAFARLSDFIAATFVAGADGLPVRVDGASYGEFDAFYEARGSFNALVGCNTWTARALREAGLRTGWWNPLPQSLAWSLALHN